MPAEERKHGETVSSLGGIRFLFFMRIRLNGEEKDTEAQNLEELLHEMEVRPEGVAVEVNLLIIKKKDYPIHPLQDGDAVEVVKFVGGG
jgi:thiamine biosynthesis protein ThiS